MLGGRLHCSLVMTLVMTSLTSCEQATSNYLENAVKSLRSLRQLQTFTPDENVQPSKSEQRRSHQHVEDVPPLTLTKGELTAIYEQAIAKGETVKVNTDDNGYVNALVHHIDEDAHPEKPIPTEISPHHHEAVSEDAGYYYYYYPIKSFLEEFTSQPPEEHHQNSYHQNHPHHHHHHRKEVTTYNKPPYTYHSHHHQHNITIQTADEKKEAKPMEHPLVMAISGFIGMAVMFVLSMVVLPKLGATKPKVSNDVKKKDQLDDFARFALNAIEGNCAERFACELTKTARSFDMEDNRFYKLLKRVAPGAFGRYIKNSGKYANKQLQCTAIPCKRKKPGNQPNTRKPPNKNQVKKINPNKRF